MNLYRPSKTWGLGVLYLFYYDICTSQNLFRFNKRPTLLEVSVKRRTDRRGEGNINSVKRCLFLVLRSYSVPLSSSVSWTIILPFKRNERVSKGKKDL